MKKLFWLLAFLWVLSGAAPAVAAAPPDVIVVRVVDYRTTATLYVTRGTGKTEEVEVKTPFMGFDKSMVAVSEGYHLVLQQLYQEGYRLQSTLGATTTPGPGPEVFTLIFVRAS